MDHELFCASFLRQPLLFIRARPGFEQAVQNKLKQAGIEFTLTRTGTLSMPNGTKAEQLLDLDKEAVIQDLSSQKTAAFMEDCKGPVNPSVWDCCAASGGKSILLTDVFQQQLSLAVSDIRPGILKNLRERFRKAGINNYRVFTADLSREAYPPAAAKYDLVVCDAPCSGSGTWARTPDQLCFFTKEKAESYASLQKKIIANAFSSVKPGGCFLYITCSVFRMENEAAVDYIKEKFQPGLIRLELIKGYESGADTMFAALFRK
jgi:16S rRNA (cytosine967-C5)-methyltransferase